MKGRRWMLLVTLLFVGSSFAQASAQVGQQCSQSSSSDCPLCNTGCALGSYASWGGPYWNGQEMVWQCECFSS